MSAIDEPIRYDVSAMIAATRSVQRTSDAIRGLAVPGAPHGSPPDAELALRRARINLNEAGAALHDIAKELAVRAMLIARADATGNPLTLLVAMTPKLPVIKGLSPDTAGPLGSAASALDAIMQHRGDMIEELLTAPERVRYAQLLDDYVEAAAAGKSGRQLERLAARLANSHAAILSDTKWAGRFKALGKFVGGAGSLLSFYSAYHSSEAGTTAGQFTSAGLSTVLTSNTGLAAFDVLTQGGVSGQADGLTAIGEDVVTSVVTGDSRHLGESAENWWTANQNRQNGWYWYGMSYWGDRAAPHIGGALDAIGGEGWPFDGDGSVNWVPGV